MIDVSHYVMNCERQLVASTTGKDELNEFSAVIVLPHEQLAEILPAVFSKLIVEGSLENRREHIAELQAD